MVLILTSTMELTSPPSVTAAPPDPLASYGRERLSVGDYLIIYRAVGGPLAWDERLLCSREDLSAVLKAPESEVFVLKLRDEKIGFCEFHRHAPDELELCNFGLVQNQFGNGLGRYFLSGVLSEVWSQGLRRVWLKTDDWDDPRALPLYEKLGFRLIARQMEER